MRAVVFALLAAGAWGAWALFTKLATRTLAPEAVLVVSYLVGSAIGLGFLLWTGEESLLGAFADTPGLSYAVAGGVATGLGSVAYYTGLQSGSVSVVSTVTALYFVVAVLLGVFLLGEPFSATKALGVALAIGAVVLLSQ
ncbi:EamA family transporter [Salinigranum halophilum]|uniref:EamA family transporter n=1 Tax=Salinigranum halophilum TaxID=2565931 RepID=UPI0010A7DD22|nr:EamA family transporter [Salinigranum halophilum]